MISCFSFVRTFSCVLRNVLLNYTSKERQVVINKILNNKEIMYVLHRQII